MEDAALHRDGESVNATDGVEPWSRHWRMAQSGALFCFECSWKPSYLDIDVKMVPVLSPPTQLLPTARKRWRVARTPGHLRTIASPRTLHKRRLEAAFALFMPQNTQIQQWRRASWAVRIRVCRSGRVGDLFLRLTAPRAPQKPDSEADAAIGASNSNGSACREDLLAVPGEDRAGIEMENDLSPAWGNLEFP